MGVEIFLTETEEQYNVFFGHELMGHIKKNNIQSDRETLERTLRRISYKYTNFVYHTGEFAPKPRVTYKRSSRKEDGILKEVWGWFW